MTTVAPTALDVAEVFDEIDDVPHELTLLELQPESAFYVAQTGSRTYTASELSQPADYIRQCIEDDFPMHFASIYNREGTKVHADDFPPGWLHDLMAGLPSRLVPRWRRHPNAVLRSGDYLLVSHGMWVPTRGTESDGEQAFEFITEEAAHRLAQARQAAHEAQWRIAHPEVDAAMPEWATDIEIYTTGLDQLIEYVRPFTMIALTQMATHTPGDVTLSGEGATCRFFEREDLTVQQMRTLAAELTAAADILDEVDRSTSRTVRRRVTVDTNLRALDD